MNHLYCCSVLGLGIHGHVWAGKMLIVQHIKSFTYTAVDCSTALGSSVVVLLGMQLRCTVTVTSTVVAGQKSVAHNTFINPTKIYLVLFIFLFHLGF